MGRYKPVKQTGKLTDLVADACSELESLKDEMVEWRDNMEGTPAENTGKFEIVSDTANNLESYVDEIDTSALPDDLKDLDVSYTMHKVTGGRSGPSREMRCIDACAMLEAVLEELDSFVKQHPEFEEVANVSQEVGELIGNVSGMEFPGMYG